MTSLAATNTLPALALLLTLTAAQGLAAEGVSGRARALHERILTLDSHLDTPAQFDDPDWDILKRHEPTDGNDQVDYPRMIEGGLDGGLWVIFTPERGQTLSDHRNARDHGLQRLLRIHALLAAHPDKFELARTAEDALRLHQAGKRVVYISIENASPLATDPSLLQFYFDQGVRVLGLVHTANNEFADSSSVPPKWQGLSEKGRELVAEANRLGIVIDQSHASDTVFDQLLELSKAPILLSHSSADAVHEHPRNIDDERLRRLAAKGGVIQVNALGAYLADTGETGEYRRELRDLIARFADQPDAAELASAREELARKYTIRKATFEDYKRHVLHILKVVGPDHVGFGADWDGGGGVIGLEDVSRLPKLTEWLLQEGYTEQQIANIWSGNLLRVIGAAQRVANELAPAAK